MQSISAIKDLQYGVGNGHPLLLDIYRPAIIREKLPVIIWIHGGAWNSGSKDDCPISFLAGKTQVAIVSLNYRLSQEARFPAQLNDCKGVVRWIRANSKAFNLDPNRIGAIGASAGGYLALLLATTGDCPALDGKTSGDHKFSSGVSCVCALYPPTDLNGLVTDPVERRNPDGDVAKLIGGAVQLNIQSANAASPLYYISSNTVPIFLVHGALDHVVPSSQSVNFYRKLLKNGVPAYLEIIPNQGHGLIPPKAVASKIFQFFRIYMGVNLGP